MMARSSRPIAAPARKRLSGRLERLHRPYHRAVADVIAAREDPIIVAIHSFTPQFVGRPFRPWHVAVLYSGDTRLAYPLLARLNGEGDLCVGDNEPYSGHLPDDSMDRHGIQPGRLHTLIEVRNDLIENPAEQEKWGKRLARILDATVTSAEL